VAKFHTYRLDEVEPQTAYQGPRDATGVKSSRRMSPEKGVFSLWLAFSELEDGATITWTDRHGDDGVYIVEGAMEIEGSTCPTGGAFVVESGHATEAKAVGPTTIAHYGSWDDDAPAGGLFGAPDPGHHKVHVMGPGGWFLSGKLEDVGATWFTDSTCGTCRCALFKVENSRSDRAPTHHHTEDEIIFLIEGGLKMGAFEYPKFSALCIPGMARYSFTGMPGGHVFLNFRRDVSNQFNDRNGPPMLETAAAREGVAVNDFIGV
jgi:hypothetical protein